MIEITGGVTIDQLLAAMNGNLPELAVNWDVDMLSFEELTLTMVGDNQLIFNINHNFRALSVYPGMTGTQFVSAINNSLTTIVHRFQDLRVGNVFNVVSYEPTALVSDDGERMDVWDGAHWYRYTTDGVNFSENVPVTGIGVSYAGFHMTKDGSTYYCYAMGWFDNKYSTIHCFSSTDRINFTDLGEVVGLGINGGWDVVGIGNCFVWKEGAVWYMIYDAVVYNRGWGEGLATASAPEGPWTQYASNPILPWNPAWGEGYGNVELPRVNNEVIKHNGRYVLYSQFDNSGPRRNEYRLNSADLYTWTIEGSIINTRIPPVFPAISNNDIALCQFKGKSYLFHFNNANGGTDQHVDMLVDNRALAELLALYP